MSGTSGGFGAFPTTRRAVSGPPPQVRFCARSTLALLHTPHNRVSDSRDREPLRPARERVSDTASCRGESVARAVGIPALFCDLTPLGAGLRVGPCAAA